MIVLGQILGRIDRFGLGYVLFRITSDVEKLPFPMAPVGALGVTALADSSASGTGEAPGWRWRVFSIGGMIGLVFGTSTSASPPSPPPSSKSPSSSSP